MNDTKPILLPDEQEVYDQARRFGYEPSSPLVAAQIASAVREAGSTPDERSGRIRSAVVAAVSKEGGTSLFRQAAEVVQEARKSWADGLRERVAAKYAGTGAEQPPASTPAEPITLKPQAPTVRDQLAARLAERYGKR